MERRTRRKERIGSERAQPIPTGRAQEAAGAGAALSLTRDIVAEVKADARVWRETRFRLYCVFKNAADAARACSLYGSRTAKQIAECEKYLGEVQ